MDNNGLLLTYPVQGFFNDQDDSRMLQENVMKESSILKAHDFQLYTCKEHHQETESDEFLCIKQLLLKLGRLGRIAGRLEIENVIRILQDQTFQLENFNKLCSGYKDCLKEEENNIKMVFAKLGFEKEQITDTYSNFSCHIYLRSPIQLLQRQIEGSSQNTTFFNTPRERTGGEYFHPMMPKLGTAGVQAIRAAVMRSTRSDVLWHDANGSTSSSFAGLVQVYLDKSKLSLKESAFHF